MSILNASSVLVYEGPSMLDGHPIIGALTGLRRKSKNPKTGQIPQLWILRSDMHPMDAIRAGADYSICGDCVHRGHFVDERWTRSCYVNPMGPSSVYTAYTRGKYPLVSIETARLLLAGLTLRLGAYGDPAALPHTLVEDLANAAKDHVGYTHQPSLCHDTLKKLVMASVETKQAGDALQAQGWRTFRILRPHETVSVKQEFLCPASKEAGHKTTCEHCTLCGGANTNAKSVAIYVHGSYSGNLSRNLEAAQ